MTAPERRRPLEFAVSITPEAEDPAKLLRLVGAAEAAGLELVAIQDHPYQRRFLDTWTLLSYVAARTDRIRLFPNVANLPLRPPAVLAKAAASLDVLSGGRVELGLGAGFFWDGVAAMGGPRRGPGEAVDALAEAIDVIRLVWSEERAVSYDGRFYSLSGLHPGPPPAHQIGIWLGALKPRMLALTGRAADGWSVSLGYAGPDELPAMQRRVDEAAVAAGRSPASIRRMLNVPGDVTADDLARFVELGFDTFDAWAARENEEASIRRFGEETAPRVRQLVGG
jgi:alkanesulfonate monooxygenase SsuD/methylene tetrahydromethanopterin reductase-like flavin-dependent oxidoreductase (luciferase family)